jgi:hypothetical protein
MMEIGQRRCRCSSLLDEYTVVRQDKASRCCIVYAPIVISVWCSERVLSSTCLSPAPFSVRLHFVSIMANASVLLKNENHEMEVLLLVKHSVYCTGFRNTTHLYFLFFVYLSRLSVVQSYADWWDILWITNRKEGVRGFNLGTLPVFG